MGSAFTEAEKRKFMQKKHLKDHLFEYILDFIGPILFTMLLLYFCKAEEPLFGIILSVAYSTGKTVYNIRSYKKKYIDIDKKDSDVEKSESSSGEQH